MRNLLRIQNKSVNFDESVFFLAIALLGNNLFDFPNAYRKDGFFLQAALSVCLTARVFRSVSNALNSTFNPRVCIQTATESLWDSSTIEMSTIKVPSTQYAKKSILLAK